MINLNDIVMYAKKVVIEFSGQLGGEAIKQNSKNSIAGNIGESASWLGGIHLNKAIDREIIRIDKDSVYYPDFLEEKMKSKVKHLEKYEKQLSSPSTIQR